MSDNLVADEPETIVKRWIEEKIGTIERIERQGRWRPAWFVDARQDGNLVRLYVRGSRGGYWPPRPLSYEAKVQQYFHDNGLRVPKIYGFIDELPAIVTEAVPGRAGLGFSAEADRVRVLEELARQMAGMHSLDPEPLYGFGTPRAADSSALTSGYLRDIEAIYRASKTRPEPCIEFILGWLKRNAPRSAIESSVIAVDSGQFMYEGGELTSLIDLELVCVGDRWTDLGALRTRNRAEPFGVDLNHFYSIYETVSGVELDLERIRYHGVGISMLCPLMVAGTLSGSGAGTDYHEYLTWWAFCLKDALEQLAEISHIDLELFEEPTESAARFPGLSGALAELIPSGAASEISGSESVSGWESHNQYVATKTMLVSRALSRLHEYLPEVERRYVRDVASLIGVNPVSWPEADRMLEEFVGLLGGQREEELIRIFHRHIRGICWILADVQDWGGKYEWLTEPIEPVVGGGPRTSTG